MPEIHALLHAGLLVADLARARDFYESVLGLRPYPHRPDLPYPGAWYELGVKDMAALKSRLDAAGIAYTVSQSGRAALFCRDPDMNTLEFVEIA